MPSSTMTRLVAVQLWPVRPKPPITASFTASSRSASSSTMVGFLPPISSWTRAKCSVALRVDAGAGGVRAGEGEAADEGARGKRRPDRGAGAGDEVEDAGRQAGVLQALDELERRERRGRRRLEDDGVAVDERRRDLPRRDGDREVPRRDDGDDAERLAAAEQHRLRRVGRQHVAAEAPALAGEVAQDVARPRDLALASASVLPSSRVSVAAMSSDRSSSSSAARNRIAPRAGAGVAAHAGNASAAAATACSASAAVALGKVASTSSRVRRVARLEGAVVGRADPLAADQVLADLHVAHLARVGARRHVLRRAVTTYGAAGAALARPRRKKRAAASGAGGRTASWTKEAAGGPWTCACQQEARAGGALHRRPPLTRKRRALSKV